MPGVTFFGNPTYWKNIPRAEKPDFAFSLTDDVVLGTASHDYRHLKRISQPAALACTSRLALRVLLGQTKPCLNPSWETFKFPSENFVVKGSVSTLNLGVRFFAYEDQLESMKSMLRTFTEDLDNRGMIEEYIQGEQFEVDGFRWNGNTEFFYPLHQTWDRKTNKILEYNRVTDYHIDFKLKMAATSALDAIGLDNSCFCIEIKLDEKLRPYIIEIHARLGDDKNLEQILWPTPPLQHIQNKIIGVI